MTYYFTPSRMGIIKKTIASIDEDTKKLEHFYIDGGNVIRK